MAEDLDDAAVVRSIIDLARALGLRVSPRASRIPVRARCCSTAVARSPRARISRDRYPPTTSSRRSPATALPVRLTHTCPTAQGDRTLPEHARCPARYGQFLVKWPFGIGPRNPGARRAPGVNPDTVLRDTTVARSVSAPVRDCRGCRGCDRPVPAEVVQQGDRSPPSHARGRPPRAPGAAGRYRGRARPVRGSA